MKQIFVFIDRNVYRFDVKLIVFLSQTKRERPPDELFPLRFRIGTMFLRSGDRQTTASGALFLLIEKQTYTAVFP